MHFRLDFVIFCCYYQVEKMYNNIESTKSVDADLTNFVDLPILNLVYLFSLCWFPTDRPCLQLINQSSTVLFWKYVIDYMVRFITIIFMFYVREVAFRFFLTTEARKTTVLWKKYPRESTVGLQTSCLMHPLQKIANHVWYLSHITTETLK